MEPREHEGRSLIDLQARTAREFAGRPAILWEGRAITFSEFDDRSGRAAGGLARRGIRPGDRVGLYAINCDAFAVAYFAILKAGATAVPINVLLNPREVLYILEDSGAAGLIYHEKLAPQVGVIRGELASVSLFVSIGGGLPGDDDLAQLEEGDAAPPAPALDPAEDVAAIIYTSGTTGQPKGAMLTHRNLVANTFSVREALALRPGEDVLIVVLPMFHSFAATVGMLFPLLHGCALVPLPRFEPELVARAIEESRATIFLGVPSMYGVLLRLRHEMVARFASLRFCVSGGAALPVEIMSRFEEKFAKLIYEGDGPTECSPVTCVNPIGGRRKIGSVGIPIPRVEMKILGDDGGELPRGEMGEICVRGPNVMKGYWRREEDTRESFFGEWFRTGDIGYEDDDGYFFIVDRKKDMIIVNGMNVYPRVVEEVLYAMEAVREAAVVGEPHELHGEIPVAHISLQEGSTATDRDIREHCLQHLGRHEVPRRVRFHGELPKNAAGKIIKRQLRLHGERERGVDLVGG
ncbi:MAG: long-chain fatty acid--CoA ligase [Planctomycetes bacterium]|nr:long-chain fatty acid--CoA ligase [Planctomycetota bacterium]